MRAFDFFCGAGGFTRGLMDAGIAVVAGVDSDARCREAYERNNGVRFVHARVENVDVRTGELAEHLHRTDDLLFSAAVPCQPSGKTLRSGGTTQDPALLSVFGRLVASVRPAFVLVENVAGIIRGRGRTTLEAFRRTLDDSGYRRVDGIVDAKHYGVPQNRRRFVLLAARTGPEPRLPEPTHGRNREHPRTVREAIGRFPRIGAGEASPQWPNHRAARVSERNLERLRATPPDGGDRRSWPDHLWLACHRKDNAGHSDVYGRMAWDRPSPALTCRCHSISNGRYGHPEQDRAISLREAAAIQTFPDDYEFYGYDKAIARQIGNAVPVLLARRLGEQVLELAERRG